ncbi:deoxynucleotidyltransferase terminal-interacting protein 2 isoform X2 [Rhinichthys klamathensis goyatoka]|uniref:deoxynucleotidyltransferase terminal-interacting protein 2 isoform X2 n=1 Tax=Rhinichthys klamathensis goyatoka TaxID=3034132 RepID=UPI0024B588E8|nr:deoxynucleotidyltransferase terminal-interacting protein 2 isoform X2 [Rhinichthys klamathensis goyatoka]
MVATRRGTRVDSPMKNTSDENSGATPTPSTRRTRRRTLMEENQSQSELTSDSQPDEPKDDSTASSLAASTPKRDTRRSIRILADKKQPDSTHEADVSESESCCSVVSDVQATPRTRRSTVVVEKRTAQDELSEAESCLSTVSETNSRRAPRSLRKRVLTSTASKDAEKVDDDPSGAESCSSAVSLTKVTDTRRITRSHRKTAVRTTDADPSEAESCSSSVSGLRGSVVRRSARNQKVKPIEPIPLSLEETTDTPSSPMPMKLRGRSCKTGVEDGEYDSDACKSGPSMSPWRATRRQPKRNILVGESDSESNVCTSQGSPSPQRGRGTPCSSRTGSSSSARAVPVTRTRKARLTSDAAATAMPEELELHHESIPVPDGDKAEDTDQLDSTMTTDTSEAQECTMIEEKAEDTTVILDQDEPVEMLEPQSSMQDVKPVEDCETETLMPQEEPVAETSATLIEDKEPGESMENNAPEFVETSHVVVDQTCTEPVEKDTVEAAAEDPVLAVVEKIIEDQRCSEPVSEDTVETAAEDPVPAVVEKIIEDQRCSETVTEDTVETAAEDPVPAVVEKIIEDQRCSEPVTEDTVEDAPKDLIPYVVEEHEEIAECEKKGVIVSEEANDTKSTEDDSVTLKDLEGPSTSSHSQAYLTTTEETSKELPPQKEMISLLDSSEDEDSADEGLSSEEGCSQEAVDVESEDVMMCPEENQMSEEAEAHGNGLFVIDTRPGLQPEEQYYIDNKQTKEEDEDDFVDEEGDDDDDDDSKVLFAPKKPLIQLSSSIDPGLKMKELGGLYISFDGNKPKNPFNSSQTQKNPNNQDELLKKSVIVPDFEKKDAVPPYKESKHAAKHKRKAEREKTTGDGWFNMKAPELTEELKNDLKAQQMRSAMDPKRFYKKNDREGFPKYFQVGTVVDSPVDFYNSRIPKKQRKRTIVEELLADAEFRSYNKRKYQEIMTEKAAQAAGKMNKKHKFHKKKMNK